MKFNEFKELVMAAASANGLNEYDLYYSEGESLSVEALHHDINAFSTSTSAGACFRCIYKGKLGSAATELFTAKEAQRIVESAMDNADAIENNESAFIHPAGDTYQQMDPVTTTEPTAAQLIDLVMTTQEAAYQQDPRVIDGTQSMAQFSRGGVSLCNSKGLDLSYQYDYTVALCFPVVKVQDEMFDGMKMQADNYTNFRPTELAAKAVEDAVATIGADTIETGKYDIVFSNKMTATLLSTFLSSFSAQAAQRGISLWKDKVGQSVASPLVTITDDPAYEGNLIRVPFDSEGVATYRKDVVKDGQLITLLHNLSTASKAGVTSTGNGAKAGYAAPVAIMPYNFYMEKGTAGTREDIFQTIGNGIYITKLDGLHAGANPASGDFSLSAAGFLIKDGKKDRPLKNFTISGNFYQVLKDVAMVGSDLEFQMPRGTSCFGGPSIVVKEMAVAGK